MAPMKKTTRKPTTRQTGTAAKRKATKRTPASAKKAKKSSTRTPMSPAHKRALADGRSMSATVDRYLTAVNTPKRRGRKVSKEALQSRLGAAQARAKTASGVKKVLAAQQVRELRTQLAAMDAANTSDLKTLETGFIKIAQQFSENRGITYGSWRNAGVPAEVLKKAGIRRSRS